MSNFLHFITLIVVLSPFTFVFYKPVHSYRPKINVGPTCTKDSKDLTACVNGYMEKEYPALSRSMFPTKRTQSDSHHEVCEKRSDYNHMAIEGPELTTDCHRLDGIYGCLKEELYKCHELSGFFSLRHVLFSLKKILQWLCGESGQGFTPDRFLVLLESAQCLECLRTSNKSSCYQQNNEVIVDSHLWLKILRLEVGPEICYELKQQVECIKNQREMMCYDDKTIKVYNEITNILIEIWCDLHPFRQEFSSSSNSNYSKISLHSLLTVLCIFWSQILCNTVHNAS